MAALRREAMACRNVSRPSGGPDDQHVRCASRRLLLLRVRFFGLFRRWCRPGGPVQDVHRGLVGCQDPLGGQRRSHRVIKAGVPEPRGHPGGGLIDPAGRDRNAQQHAHDQRGALGRHVPVSGQQYRGGVQHRPVGR
jgi:hypothetical protein